MWVYDLLDAKFLTQLHYCIMGTTTKSLWISSVIVIQMTR